MAAWVRPYRFAFTPTSTRSERSSSGARVFETTVDGSSSSMCESRLMTDSKLKFLSNDSAGSVPMSSDIVLLVNGAVEQPLELQFADLAALPAAAQVPDVSRFHPK